MAHLVARWVPSSLWQCSKFIEDVEREELAEYGVVIFDGGASRGSMTVGDVLGRMNRMGSVFRGFTKFVGWVPEVDVEVGSPATVSGDGEEALLGHGGHWVVVIRCNRKSCKGKDFLELGLGRPVCLVKRRLDSGTTVEEWLSEWQEWVQRVGSGGVNGGCSPRLVRPHGRAARVSKYFVEGRKRRTDRLEVGVADGTDCEARIAALEAVVGQLQSALERKGVCRDGRHVVRCDCGRMTVDG